MFRRSKVYRLYPETKKQIITLSTAAIMLVSGLSAALPVIATNIAHAISGVTYTNTGFSSVAWGADRKLPTGGWSVAGDTLTMTVDGNVAPANGFYAFEGVKGALPANTNNVSAKLFVDPTWADQTVIAGMWAQAPDPANPTNPAWPTLEFNNVDNATASVDVWDTFGTPGNEIKGVTTVQYGDTIELEIQLDTITNTLSYYLNGMQIYSSSAHGTGPLSHVIFDNYNDGTAGKGYTTVWSNLKTGIITAPDAPANLRWMANGAALACGSSTNVPLVAPTWDASAGAVSYKYSYQMPGGSWQNDSTVYTNPTTGNTSFGSADGIEGVWKFKVVAVGGNGLQSDVSAECAITFDKTAPAAPTNLGLKTGAGATLTNGGFTNSMSVIASWNAAAGADSYTYKYWNNIAGSSYNSEASAWQTPVAGTSQPGVFNQGDGTHYIAVKACDSAGNCSAFTAPFAITYDGIKPVVTANVTDNQELTGTVNVVETVVEANPAAYNIRVLTSTGASVAITPGAYQSPVSGSTLSYSWDTTKVADGTYKLQFSARDKAGNSTTIFKTVVVKNTQILTGDTTNSGTGTDTGTVAGASTDTSSSVQQPVSVQRTGPLVATSSSFASDETAPEAQQAQQGQVKGESITKFTAPAKTDTVQKASNSGRFLGLGWWWLPVLLALAGFWWFIAAIRRRRDDEERA
ncbi:MAG: hypothetical protein QG629_581 [Patescibacteria group bacterium]|nr:Ig-like domain repeat protein [Candidatus Saccharibacteria bacterium]MDQ5963499.1 hypothetical protein [Patescibacteria group bacterium]